MSDFDFASIQNSILIFGIISIIVYLTILRPLLPNARNEQAAAGRTPTVVATTTARPVVKLTKPKEKAARIPYHVDPSIRGNVQAGGFNILADGLVSFRFTKAAKVESTLGSDEQTQNRKDRARIMARVLEGTSVTAPPPKGSTVVVAIKVTELSGSSATSLLRVLYLLGTFYNLLIVVAVDETTARSVVLDRLRAGGVLSEAVLPDHRVTLASSATGRIALVRQVQRVDLTIEFDSEAATTLTRFGHQVKVLEGDERFSALLD